VSLGTNTYRYIGGNFQNTGSAWLNNYEAKILKVQTSNVVDNAGKVLEANVQFYFISESDSRGCYIDEDWVRASDFIDLRKTVGQK